MSGRDVTIRTNSLGFRGPELGAKSIPRALFLGDSITLGEWLNEEETFVFRVASLSSAAGRPVETINAGLAGASLEDELAILVESGLATSPDLVVLCFYLNDVWSSRRVRPIRPPRFLDRSALTWHLLDGLSRLPFRSSRDEYIDAGLEAEWREEIRSRLGEGPGDPRRDPKAFNRLVLSRVSDWGSAFSEKAWVRLDRLLSKLARQAKESRFRVLVAAFPVRIQVEADFLADFPQRRLQEVASRLGLPVLDLLPPLRKAFRESPEPLFFDHCHPTIRGQEAVAPLIEVEVARALAGRPAL